MAIYNYILVRDTLDDTGTVPSPGYPCASPDLICQQTQVTDPQTYFKNNYTSDPNQSIEFGGEPNFVYVRGKNMADNAKSGYMFVYWSKGSLLLTPSNWIKNQLKVIKPGGVQVPYIEFLNVASQEIRASMDHYTWVPQTREHTCLVGVMSPTSIPNIPSSFADNEAFVSWVRQNQNVCWRNLNIENQHPDPSYVSIYPFGNLDDTQVLMFFQVVVSNNIPIGTTINLKCEPLSINWSQQITTDPQSRTVLRNGNCPSKYEGTVNILAYLPQGKTWPPGGQIDTTAWIGAMAKHPIARFGIPIKKFAIPANDTIPAGYSNGYLTRLGNCAVRFV